MVCGTSSWSSSLQYSDHPWSSQPAHILHPLRITTSSPAHASSRSLRTSLREVFYANNSNFEWHHSVLIPFFFLYNLPTPWIKVKSCNSFVAWLVLTLILLSHSLRYSFLFFLSFHACGLTRWCKGECLGFRECNQFVSWRKLWGNYCCSATGSWWCWGWQSIKSSAFNPTFPSSPYCWQCGYYKWARRWCRFGSAYITRWRNGQVLYPININHTITPHPHSSYICVITQEQLIKCS